MDGFQSNLSMGCNVMTKRLREGKISFFLLFLYSKKKIEVYPKPNLQFWNDHPVLEACLHAAFYKEAYFIILFKIKKENILPLLRAFSLQNHNTPGFNRNYSSFWHTVVLYRKSPQPKPYNNSLLNYNGIHKYTHNYKMIV